MEKAEPTYRRGQLEIALWQTFTQGSAQSKISRTFKGRVQKLLDLDRTVPPAKGWTEFAFHENAPPGRGQEVAFALLDAFCLAIDLDLLDLGFKQSEVVLVMRHLTLPRTYLRPRDHRLHGSAICGCSASTSCCVPM